MRHRLFLIILLTISRVGCNQKPEDSPIETMPETFPETTAESIPETMAESGLSFSMQTDGIAFSLDGAYLQRIPIEQELTAEDILLCDYDSDGFEDVFIPKSYSSKFGYYYRYDPDEKQLVLWDALNFERNGMGYVMQLAEDGRLVQYGHNHYGTTKTTYRWQDDILLPEELLDYYFAGDETIEDCYVYSEDGEKVLLRRTIYDTYGNTVHVVEDPLYFRVESDRLSVMKGEQLAQALPIGDFWEGYAALIDAAEQQTIVFLEAGSYIYEPEFYLGTDDYDFDGHTDLYIPDTLTGNCTGTYYRFDPESGKFVHWDAMNAIGHEMYVNAEERTLNAYVGNEGERVLHSYRWKNGVLAEIPAE